MTIPTSPSTYDAVAAVLAASFQVEPGRIAPEATLASLGLDSLALMEFVFAVEDRFEVRIPEDRLDPRESGVTLAALAGLIDEARAAKAAAVSAAPATAGAAAAATEAPSATDVRSG